VGDGEVDMHYALGYRSQANPNQEVPGQWSHPGAPICEGVRKMNSLGHRVARPKVWLMVFAGIIARS